MITCIQFVFYQKGSYGQDVRAPNSHFKFSLDLRSIPALFFLKLNEIRHSDHKNRLLLFVLGEWKRKGKEIKRGTIMV